MKQIFITFILIWFVTNLLTSCNSKKKPNLTDPSDTRIVKIDNIDKTDFSVTDIQYIPLETREDVLIGSIDKILFQNNAFYIFDRLNKSIYTFNSEGKILSVINKEGNGPGEYAEIIDVDVDKDGNVYVADNGKTQIIKYIKGITENYETIYIGEHFLEFCFLGNNQFVLNDIFNAKGEKMKLALFNGESKSTLPLLDYNSNGINELNILRCSKHYFYRSGENVLYYNRFTPSIYSIDKSGKISEILQINSNKHIPYSNLKELEKNPLNFMREKNYIKDIICIYETSEHYVCMPFITPMPEYLFISKKENSIKKINLIGNPLFHGTSTIEGVVNNKLMVVMNYSEKQANKLKHDNRFMHWNEESNPVLVLFSIK